MANGPENPQEREETRNFIYGSVTAALGLAAVVGSFALPMHNRQVRELRYGLDIAGFALMIKGHGEMLESNSWLDRYETGEPED